MLKIETKGSWREMGRQYGETFRAECGSPINLRPAQPLSFVKLAA